MLFVVLLLSLLAIARASVSPIQRLRPSVLAGATSASKTSVESRSKWSVAAEEIAPAAGLLGRLPALPIVVAAGTLGSFLQTFAVMLPVGMVINSKVLIKEGLKPWAIKGSTLGIDWGKVSALFVGGEKLLFELRGKEDRWNQILGSGLASALLRVNDGPVAMLQGGMMGSAFIMVIDMMSVNTDANANVESAAANRLNARAAKSVAKTTR